MIHYLDHAATTPVPRAVADAMYEVLTNQYGNPGSQYPMGRDAHAMVERCRGVIAGALGCAPEQFVFTSCGTESDNYALRLASYQGRHIGRHIITTAVEHSAVLEPCRQLEQEGWDVTYLRPDRNGNISLEQLEEALREDTVLVSLMLVNNETGCVFPVAQAAQLLKRRASKALLHTDAVQGFLKLPFTAASLGADLISVSGHKVGAPKGIGGLYFSERVRAKHPLLAGGGQEMGLRSGTEATAQIAGFAKAVELRQEQLPLALAHMAELKEYALARLLSIEGVERIGNGAAPHILSFSLSGYPSANVVEDLGKQGICISAGSACHRGKASHVYEAMLLPRKVKAGALRVSFGPETERADIDALADAIERHRSERFPML